MSDAPGGVAGPLEARLEGLVVRYANTDDPMEYDAVGTELDALADELDGSGRADLAAEALLTSADCAVWATLAAGGPDAARVRRGLAAVDRLGELPVDLAPMRRDQLGSIATQLIGFAARLGDDDTERAVLVRVLDLVERSVPADVAFDNLGGARARARLAVVLAGCSRRLEGVVRLSLVRRLDVALELAVHENDVEAALVASQGLLAHARWSRPDGGRRLRRFVAQVAADGRARRITRLGRLGVGQAVDETVGELLDTLLDDPDPDPGELLELTEHTSARTLADGIAGLLRPTLDPECRDLERRIVAYAQTTAPDPVRRELALVSELPMGATREDEAARVTLVGELEHRYASLGAGFDGAVEPLALAEIQSLLSPGEVMVRYVLPYHPLHPAYRPSAVVVTRTVVRHVPLAVPERDGSGLTGTIAIDGRSPVDQSPLGNAVVLARFAAGAGGTSVGAPENALQDLYAMVLAPVRDTGLLDGASRVILVPQRALHLAPWGALRDADGRWLIEDHVLSVAPSASAWARLRTRAPDTGRGVLAIGDPDAGYAGLPPLPAAAAEARQVAAIWRERGAPADVLESVGATFAALRDGVVGRSLLHIAAHGSFPGDQALFDHALLLAQDLVHEGRVTADAVRSIPLRDVGTVVLGVCDGGAYRVGPGDEPYGLVPAFLEAGARSVVASQWAVDDALGHDLFLRVGAWLTVTDAADAVRRSILDLRRELGPAAAAAVGVVCVGDPTGPAPG